MRLIIVLLFCLLFYAPYALAQGYSNTLPTSTRVILDRTYPGWKFSDVNSEVRQFLEREFKGTSPVVISGDFDGNRKRDYAALINYGYEFNADGKAIGPRHFLVIFLRRTTGYKKYVIKDPDGEYISLAKKGTRDYNYETQKEITYANDAIVANSFEKGATSYVYKRGRFVSFVSGD
jgi:hypothetical protein